MFTKLLCLFGFVSLIAAKVSPKVKCTPDMMRIEVPLSPTMGEVYLQGLKDYPDPACRPRRDPEGSLAILELSLGDVYQCATTRVTNKLTNKQVYYQTLIIEGHDAKEEMVHIKCSVSAPRNHTITRRNVLPAGFQEAEDIDLTWSVTGRAPEPVLGVGVRQDGKLVTGELNVAPGTQLEMEISLDKVSSPVYGLLVTHMLVTDTMKQEETIIYNGCSVDPYLFGNFKTIEGDLLRAKFRAFKFPESTYVQFKGTVNVCLGKCNGIECSDGQIGYGRRRRSISAIPADPNKVFEITITSFIKVNYKDGEENFVEVIRNQTKVFGDNKLIVGNQKSERNVYVGGEEDRPTLRVKKVTEETQEQIVMTDSGSPLTQIPFHLILCITVTRLLLL
ncbi:PREDICTED: uncharacterized protein LOC108556691 [Nicrophorus vespilloides]|uniref:Uncharacterized protein LOC108556691 n=1 Tax=Nicrophorus vespilloides TaxID=110193 RepID=A0ABM1M1E0_NICVS|nr:PREDICTED: uncharacterized protein LOC108556691 [Nicrophorus vespilloides]